MDDDFFKIVFSLCLLAVCSFGFVYCGNLSEEERCASLKKQGVTAVVSTGLISKKCEVIERVMTTPQVKP